MSEQSEKLFDAITGVGEELIENAQKPAAKKRRKWYRWAGPLAAVLVIAILTGLFSGRVGLSAYAIYEAKYPKTAARTDDAAYAGTLDGFLTASIPEFLSGADGKNRVYSPLNVYMALSMLAETSDGNTRAQLLDLLGAEDIATQRERAKALWNSSYYTGDRGACVLASSLWLNKDVSFVRSTMETLAKDYRASSYKGKMGSAGFDRELQSWLNKQTGGLLKRQIDGVSLSPETVMAIATTIYFKGTWAGQYNKDATSPDVFHAPGGDQTCDFMHRTLTGWYGWGEHFSAASQGFTNGRSMWYILPDDGVSPDDLLKDAEVISFLTMDSQERKAWENRKTLQIRFSVPKFDVVSDIDLLPGLAALGVTDALNPAAADFSAMVKQPTDGTGMPVWVDKASHAARVTVDEEGCVAVAYTAISVTGGTRPPDEIVDFTLDRPFLFAITGTDGLPLFVGIVNNPVS